MRQLPRLTIKETILFFKLHYGTEDPFAVADMIDLEYEWENLPDKLPGRTTYILGNPVIMLNRNIRWSPQRYAVMAHEFGHVLLHGGVATWYHQAGVDSKLEAEADNFSLAILAALYQEQFERLPETLEDLKHAYGFEPAI